MSYGLIAVIIVIGIVIGAIATKNANLFDSGFNNRSFILI